MLATRRAAAERREKLRRCVPRVRAVTEDHDAARSGSGPSRGDAVGSDGLAPVVRSVVEELSPGRAFDVATGTGRNALALAERGWTVDAVDLSSAKLSRARERASERGTTVNWILADADCYCVPEGSYDLVTVSFFDARDRLPALIDALAPGGVLCYEHYLASAERDAGPGDRFRFDSNELLAACSELAILYYAERRVGDEPRVTLVGRNETDVARWRPQFPSPR
ncbi:class I SAM-dependent methyltransferase [Haloterrigena salifodinae]|uniref:Class I SAM-dependent methyltransferase n=1 Tax=Haloterrigena salifodinae TaxID=2675099 RepID=A0A8T8E521_9EURY|nr:class I SAM-dependent methyltransferase [Haloterrigena salifodinae]